MYARNCRANTHIITHTIRLRIVCFLKRHYRCWVSVRQTHQSDLTTLSLSYILQVVNSWRHYSTNTTRTVGQKGDILPLT